MNGFSRFVTVVMVISLLGNLTLFYSLDKCKDHVSVITDTITKYQVDTVTLTTTITQIKDSLIYLDPVPIYVNDTITIMDTLYYYVPISSKYFHTEFADIWTKGYQVELDSVKVFKNIEYKYVEVPIMPEDKRWVVSIGVFGGFGPDGMVGGFGASVGYKIYEF